MIFYWMGRRGLNRLGPQSCVPHHPVHFKGTGHRGRQSGKQKSSINSQLLAISFYFPLRSFCQYHSKFSCWKLLQKQKEKSSQMSLFSDVFSLPEHFEFFAIFFFCLHFAKFVCLLKRLKRLKQEWQKSPAGTRQTYGKNLVWFGEIERRLAKLSRTTFTYRSSS